MQCDTFFFTATIPRFDCLHLPLNHPSPHSSPNLLTVYISQINLASTINFRIHTSPVLPTLAIHISLNFDLTSRVHHSLAFLPNLIVQTSLDLLTFDVNSSPHLPTFALTGSPHLPLMLYTAHHTCPLSHHRSRHSLYSRCAYLVSSVHPHST